MEHTWKTVTAGILTFVSGGFAMLGGIGLALFRGFRTIRPGVTGGSFPGFDFGMNGGMMGFPVGGFGIAAAVIIFLLAALAIIGGVFLLRRKVWGLALAGSIAAILLPMPLGILGIIATILTILSKKEFNQA